MPVSYTHLAIKAMEKTKKSLEAKLKKLLDSPKDDVVTFEELGVDRLFVDEADVYKRQHLVEHLGGKVVVDGEAEPVVLRVMDLVLPNRNVADGEVKIAGAVRRLKARDSDVCLLYTSDVYKRQGLPSSHGLSLRARRAPERAFAESPSAARPRCGIPVSYTHLDVYKRQCTASPAPS